MKKILLIATGGTIASRMGEDGLSPTISPEELLSYVPEIGEMCEVETVQPFYLDSTNVYAYHWLALSELIEKEYENYDGFVITHGTDTMAFTSAALSYLVQDSRKPIVLTGSQRSVYLRDTDARSNLIDAFSYCVDDKAQGVHIVFDGRVIVGTRAKKMRTKSYNAFSSIDFPEIALVRDGKPVYYIEEGKPTGEPLFSHDMSGRVFVLTMFPGMDPDIFDYLSTRYDAVIVQSFGSGGLPMYDNDAFFEKVRSFTDKGKFVVVGTQVEREGSALDVYAVGRRLKDYKGVLEARSMTMEATITKMMWILSKTKDEKEVRALFDKTIAKDLI